MLVEFRYYNPTKLYFGAKALANLETELKNFGDNVVLVYGMDSIKKIGLYDEVIDTLRKAGKKVSEIAGVMPNPTIQKIYEGISIAKSNNADLLLQGYST